MVSPLTYKRHDPNRKGRGAGYYYKRDSYKGGHWSKFAGSRDGTKRARTVGKSRNPRYSHTGDKNRRKKSKMKVSPSGRKIKTSKKGWF